jgi:hypothetical protein
MKNPSKNQIRLPPTARCEREARKNKCRKPKCEGGKLDLKPNKAQISALVKTTKRDAKQSNIHSGDKHKKKLQEEEADKGTTAYHGCKRRKNAPQTQTRRKREEGKSKRAVLSRVSRPLFPVLFNRFPMLDP